MPSPHRRYRGGAHGPGELADPLDDVATGSESADEVARLRYDNNVLREGAEAVLAKNERLQEAAGDLLTALESDEDPSNAAETLRVLIGRDAS